MTAQTLAGVARRSTVVRRVERSVWPRFCSTGGRCRGEIVYTAVYHRDRILRHKFTLPVKHSCLCPLASCRPPVGGMGTPPRVATPSAERSALLAVSKFGPQDCRVAMPMGDRFAGAVHWRAVSDCHVRGPVADSLYESHCGESLESTWRLS